MIQIDAITKRYGEKLAVDSLSLDVADGEVCVLIGPSGCGKTTTLRMVNRLVEPTSGRVLIDCADTRASRPEILRRSIGYAIQSVGLFPHMTVAQNIGIVPSILSWDEARMGARVHELLLLVGLDPGVYSAKYPAQLSGGEAQRVGVARALAADPPILLMDEPFGAVDPLTRERLQRQFLAIQKELKKTVVLVTHDMDEAVRLADRVAVMRDGRILQYDTPDALLSGPVNTFVRNFVGADRALKRISRIPVTSLMRAAPILVRTQAGLTGQLPPELGYAWVTDPAGRLIGWADTHSGADASAVTEIAPTEMDNMSVGETASAREALSRMLGQGVRSIPVVDAQLRLVGEVTLRAIEEVTAG
jgi:osmoprotectant transport system ATP-binding protein